MVPMWFCVDDEGLISFTTYGTSHERGGNTATAAAAGAAVGGAASAASAASDAGTHRDSAAAPAAAAKGHGHGGGDGFGAGTEFVTHGIDLRRGGADESDTVLFAQPREDRALGEEPVTRVDGLAAGSEGRMDHGTGLQVAVARPRGADAHGTVGKALADSAGVPAAFTSHTIVLPYNDFEAVTACFAANKDQIAGIIIEPVPGNAGLYLPKPGYLEFLSEITKSHGSLLIFDEVMTGFRLAKGGAQERFKITPDLSTFGKVIGGGLPVGAFGGLADIMDYLAPLGPVYQAGTLSGNPVAMAAGIANLLELDATNAYAKLEELGAQLAAGMRDAVMASLGLRNGVVANVDLIFPGTFTARALGRESVRGGDTAPTMVTLPSRAGEPRHCTRPARS